MKKNKWSPKFIMIVLYILAVIGYFVVSLAGFLFVKNITNKGLLAEQTIGLDQFTFVSAKQLADVDGKERFVSTDPDPQLIYTQSNPFYVDRVLFSASPNLAGGEIVLYYASNQAEVEQGFSEKNKLWAKQLDDGTWYFDLNGKEVYALRLDPDTTGGIVWDVDFIQLNAQRPVYSYFLPTPQDLFFIAFIPLLLAALIVYCKQISQYFIQIKNEKQNC